jgi:glycoprotein endo-alpha-1,2-mannosidase
VAILACGWGAVVRAGGTRRDGRALAAPRLLVGAYFYPWYGAARRHWADGYVRGRLTPSQGPLLGEYDSRDPATIASQLGWAQRYGVDFFVASWWGAGSYEDVTMRDHVMRSAALGPIRIALLYESLALLPQTAGTIVFDQAVEAKLIADVDYLARTYFGNPNYLRIDGRPVLEFYVSRIWRGDYAHAIATLRATIKQRYGFDLYLVGDEVDWDGAPDANRIRLFDAITPYTMYSDLQRPGWPDDTGFLGGVRARYAQFEATAHANGVRFIPNALPGFDDRGVRPAAAHYVLPAEVAPGLDGSHSLFSRFLDLDASFLDPNVPMLLVTSWNEWHEDTEIEPTISAPPTSLPVAQTQGYTFTAHGFGLLETLRRFVDAHSAPAAAPTTLPTAPAEPSRRAPLLLAARVRRTRGHWSLRIQLGRPARIAIVISRSARNGARVVRSLHPSRLAVGWSSLPLGRLPAGPLRLRLTVVGSDGYSRTVIRRIR